MLFSFAKSASLLTILSGLLTYAYGQTQYDNCIQIDPNTVNSYDLKPLTKEFSRDGFFREFWWRLSDSGGEIKVAIHPSTTNADMLSGIATNGKHFLAIRFQRNLVSNWVFWPRLVIGITRSVTGLDYTEYYWINKGQTCQGLTDQRYDDVTRIVLFGNKDWTKEDVDNT